MRFAILSIVLINWLLNPVAGQDPNPTRFAVEARFPQPSTVRFVQFNQMEKERRKSISEDAAVLNHLISKGMKLVDHRSALGVRVQQKIGNNEILYTDSGLTFIYHVPLILIDDQNQNKKSVATAKSPWQKAKEEMSLSRTPNGMLVNQWGSLKNPAGQFEKSTIESLKAQVKLALENVGNFRDLTPDDSVTVLIYGSSYQSNLRTVLGWKVKMADVKDEKVPSSAIKTVEYAEPNPNLRGLTLSPVLYPASQKSSKASSYGVEQSLPGDLQLRQDVTRDPMARPAKRGR